MKGKIRKATNAFDLVASLTSPTYAVLCITDRIVRHNKAKRKAQS